jgi:hypothetical protein
MNAALSVGQVVTGPQTVELRSILDELCITQDALAFVAGVDPDTISRLAQGRRCSPSTMWRVRYAAGMMRQVTDPAVPEPQVAQMIDWLGDTEARSGERLMQRKEFLRHLRRTTRTGRPPAEVFQEWRHASSSYLYSVAA